MFLKEFAIVLLSFDVPVFNAGSHRATQVDKERAAASWQQLVDHGYVHEVVFGGVEGMQMTEKAWRASVPALSAMLDGRFSKSAVTSRWRT